MRYIAKQDKVVTEKNKDLFTITGIKEMEAIDGSKVEILFATKDYDKKQLEDVKADLTNQNKLVNEQYIEDMKDIDAMLEAIKLAEVE